MRLGVVNAAVDHHQRSHEWCVEPEGAELRRRRRWQARPEAERWRLKNA
jgi:hypothetical protein